MDNRGHIPGDQQPVDDEKDAVEPIAVPRIENANQPKHQNYEPTASDENRRPKSARRQIPATLNLWWHVTRCEHRVVEAVLITATAHVPDTTGHDSVVVLKARTPSAYADGDQPLSCVGLG